MPVDFGYNLFRFKIVVWGTIKLDVGRPIVRSKMVNADKSYDSEEIRNCNRNRGIVTNIPVTKRNRKNPNVGRPLKLNKEEYAGRNVMERFFSGIKAFKRIYPRHARLEKSYIGFVQLACSLVLWSV